MLMLRSLCFNPRAREGRDPPCTSAITGHGVFQSTRPRRARRRHWRPVPAWQRFQSTRPRRARPIGMKIYGGQSGFQSTRPRRARLGWKIGREWQEVEFQSTRPRRARRACPARPPSRPWFQSTRPRRARLTGARAGIHPRKFQSTRPRRARQLGFYPLKFQRLGSCFATTSWFCYHAVRPFSSVC